MSPAELVRRLGELIGDARHDAEACEPMTWATFCQRCADLELTGMQRDMLWHFIRSMGWA